MTQITLSLGTLLAFVAGATAPAFLAAIADRINVRYANDLIPRMEQLGMSGADVQTWLRFRVMAAGAMAVFVAVVLRMPPVGILAGMTVFVVVRVLLERRLRVQRELLRDQLVTVARALAGQVRAQATLRQGLARVAEEIRNPLRTMLQQTLQQIDSNVPFEEAFDRFKERARMEYASLFVLTLSVANREKEGETLAKLLDRIAHSMTETARVDKKRETNTAAGRMVVWILSFFPVFFLGLFFFLHPEGTRLVFGSLAGQFLLCIVGVLTWIGQWWGQKILNRVA